MAETDVAVAVVAAVTIIAAVVTTVMSYGYDQPVYIIFRWVFLISLSCLRDVG